MKDPEVVFVENVNKSGLVAGVIDKFSYVLEYDLVKVKLPGGRGYALIVKFTPKYQENWGETVTFKEMDFLTLDEVDEILNNHFFANYKFFSSFVNSLYDILRSYIPDIPIPHLPPNDHTYTVEEIDKLIDQLQPKFVKDIINDIRKKINKKHMGPIDIIKKTESVVSYGPATGWAVKVDGQVFRMDGDDFISPKNFMIWYASTFDSMFECTKDQWKGIVSVWQSMAIKKNPGQDALAPPVIQDLIKSIMEMGVVYDDFVEEQVQNLNNSVMHVYFLKSNMLYVHSSLYKYFKDQNKLTSRKMRQICEPYLIKKHGETEYTSWRVRVGNTLASFWVFDWNKLLLEEPNLKNVKITKVEQKEYNEIETWDIDVEKAIMDSALSLLKTFYEKALELKIQSDAMEDAKVIIENSVEQPFEDFNFNYVRDTIKELQKQINQIMKKELENSTGGE